MAAFPFHLSPPSLLVWVVLAYLLKRITFELTTGAKRRQIIRDNGCKAPWAWPRQNFLGLGLMYTIIRDAKEQKFLERSRERFLKSGRNTYFTSILCRPGRTVCD